MATLPICLLKLKLKWCKESVQIKIKIEKITRKYQRRYVKKKFAGRDLENHQYITNRISIIEPWIEMQWPRINKNAKFPKFSNQYKWRKWNVICKSGSTWISDFQEVSCKKNIFYMSKQIVNQNVVYTNFTK